jgi:hypothetical protein
MLRGEMFTATVSRCPSSCHSRACCMAALSVHSVSAWIVGPLRSARGMNSAGATRLRRGGCQRASASTPTILPVRMSALGWYSSRSWSRSIAFLSCRTSREIPRMPPA